LSLVLDASLTLAWFLDGEGTAGADAVLDEVVANSAIVPPLWRIEMGNALQMAVRRQRIDRAFRDSTLRELAILPIELDGDGTAHCWSATLSLADTHALTLYDATYLELAQRRRLPLATLDRALADAAKRLDVTVKGR
jgi:predicted nucleic acid-binding protein